jgi:hypothetical protein
LTAVSRFGITVDLLPGWEAAIYERVPDAGETTHPILHVGSFGLPPARGDYGRGAVDVMGPADGFLALLEFHPAAAGTALFAQRPRPRQLSMDMFSGMTLQRMIEGQAGAQAFFAEGARAFCLYTVLGSAPLAGLIVPSLNRILSTLRIEAA